MASLAEQRSARRWRIFFRLAWLALAAVALWLGTHRGGGSSPSQPHTALVDRRVAIREAVLGATPADVILVAGKGHEDYQEIQGQRHAFSDVEEARAALIERAGL